MRRSKALPRPPKILIFDVDGVLVDVRGTYWRSALDTVRYITGKRATYAELQQWKSQPGFNDDWSMVAAWVTALGKPLSYEQARSAFEIFYWGSDGKRDGARARQFRELGALALLPRVTELAEVLGKS